MGQPAQALGDASIWGTVLGVAGLLALLCCWLVWPSRSPSLSSHRWESALGYASLLLGVLVGLLMSGSSSLGASFLRTWSAGTALVVGLNAGGMLFGRLRGFSSPFAANPAGTGLYGATARPRRTHREKRMMGF